MKSHGFLRILAARYRVIVALIGGVAVGIVVASAAHPFIAILCGWDTAALIFVAWMLDTVLHMNGEETARHASQEDPGRVASDVGLLVASVASLVAVGMVLFQASSANEPTKSILVGLGVLSVVLSWILVHTIFTLRYARLFFASPNAHIDFNDSTTPRYIDFAYVAFTIGMTFQVSDTNFKTSAFRGMALRHALLSYLFGVVIIASTINLIVGLGQ